MRNIRAAVVGLGHWGPTVAKNLQASAAFELVGVCDLDAARLGAAGTSFPAARPFTSDEAMLREVRPDLLVVCTPAATHASIVRRALEGGVDVLCEKPLATTLADAAELVSLAHRRERRLFVNHMCSGTARVQRLRERHARGELGELVHVEAVRIADGRVQPDVDVLWDLAPHDLSIVQLVLGKEARAVQASGRREAADLHVWFDGGATAHLQVSWVAPAKARRMTFQGAADSVVHEGDDPEALAAELDEIARAMRGDTARASTGEHGVAIVRVLEAARTSLREDGARVPVP